MIKGMADWSENERVFYRMCQLKKIPIKYEPEIIDLIPSATATIGRYKPTQYTPDFKIQVGSKEIMIETKGFLRDRDSIINKLADIYYYKKGKAFYVINQAGTDQNGNKNYYLYSYKGIARRGQKTRTFWEIVGAESENDHKLFKVAKQIAKFDKLFIDKKLNAYEEDLINKNANHTEIIFNSDPNTKKYKEALRKKQANDKELKLLSQWKDKYAE